jgi:glutamate racemase
MATIGVFDSGVGGLTVVKALRDTLPGERIVYVGDTARVPYGNKSHKSIIEFSRQNVSFLLGKGVAMVVVACNTASAVALPSLRESFAVPITGVIDAGVRKALSLSRTQRIGVIGTYRTIKSDAYKNALAVLAPDVTVVQKACPLFVPIVEENFHAHPATRLIIREYLDGIADAIDTLILGCTHYPLLMAEIATLYPRLALVDSATAVAEETKRLLTERSLLAAGGTGGFSCYVTDMSESFTGIARTILGDDSVAIEEISL